MAGIDLQAQAGPLSAEIGVAVGQAVREAEGPPTDPREVPAWRTRRWRRAGSPLPRKVTFSGQVLSTQPGQGVGAFFPFDARPQVGRLWSVRKVVIQGAANAPISTAPWVTAIANVTAAVYVTQEGQAVNFTSQPSPIDADQTGLAVPSTQFYSTHQLWVRGGEWLVIGVQGSGVTSGFLVWGSARVIEIDDDPAYLLDL